jgi:hypothetical protein
MTQPSNRGRKASAKKNRLRARQKGQNQQSNRPRRRKPRQPRPVFDANKRELRVGELVSKRFTQASDAQETILAAFQEENWPPSIHDPLTGKAGQEHKQRLRRAVDNLNRRQIEPLLRFRVIRQGTGIAWEFRESARR